MNRKIRAKELYLALGVSRSTLYKFIRQGRIKRPTRYSARLAVWDASYLEDLLLNGIPPEKGAANGEIGR